MDYEQKYREALERAEKILEFYKHPAYAEVYSYAKEDIPSIFPELTESEDERMRKELLDYLHTRQVVEGLTGTKVKMDWITWLEKQKAKEDLDRMAPIYEDKESFESALEKAWKFYNNSGARTVDICEDNYVECAYAKGFREGFLFGLKRHEGVLPNVKEKQKPADKVNPKFKVGDVMRTLQEADDNITSGLPVIVFVGNDYYHCTNELIAIKDQDDYEYPPMNRMQEPTDKVETRFKVCDWVVWDNKISCHIDNIYQGKGSLMYEITDVHNMTRSYGVKGFDNNAHLWTIEDVKEGDVLARNNGILSICIFAHFDGINNKYSSFLCHCGLEGEGLGQELSINGYHDDCKDYVPATKEQQDYLFKKMKEAGYVWDADKKKIEKQDTPKDYNSIDPHFGRPIETESKFKVGDWIFSIAWGTAHIIGTGVIGVNDSDFLLEYIDGKKEYTPSEYVNSAFDKWTIQDAKDGDVLVFDDIIMIFKSIKTVCTANTHVLYCDGIFFDDWCDFDNGAHPATREQRDILFQKIKEAGYKWDSQNKRLEHL